jgi:very-short-patch-repair endonuclease
VNDRLERLLRAHSGIVNRASVLAEIDHSVLDHALCTGQLARPYPCVYLDPGLADDTDALIRAALAYAGGRAAVSHTSALRTWQLPAPPGGPIHLITDGVRHLRGTPRLRVHRREDLRLEPPFVVERAGLPVTQLERSIIDSWPLLDKDAKRAPAIFAVGQRMTTPARLAETLDQAPRLAGRRLLNRLIRLLAAGCRSPLEIWGYQQVFTGPGLTRLRHQVPVRVGRRTVYLDVFDEATGVNFELDGAKYHSSDADRERDLRRDSALATQGIVVVRFTHHRLVHEPDEVRDEALSILNARRQAAG